MNTAPAETPDRLRARLDQLQEGRQPERTLAPMAERVEQIKAAPTVEALLERVAQLEEEIARF